MRNVLRLFLFCSVAMLLVSGIINFFQITSNVFLYTLGILILYTVASLRMVGPTEVGAILLFGKPIQEVGSGLQLVPLFFYSLTIETKLIIQEQFPGDPEKIDKTDTDITAPGMVTPIRVTTGPGKGTDDPIDVRMTPEVTFLARYRIEQGQFIDFLSTIGDTNEVRRQIRDTAESVLKVEFAKRSPKQILPAMGKINKILKEAVETLTNSWGIQIEDVQIVDIDLGKTVNEQLRNVPDALLRKKVTITNAEAENRRLVLEGTGKADAEKMFLEAQAVGYAKIASELKISEGELILKMQMMKEAFEKANYSVIPGSEAFSLAASISEVIKKTGGTK